MRLPYPLLSFAALPILAGAGRAQCDPSWPWPNDLGVHGAIADFAHWDPDGPGPAGDHVVVVGRFAAAGNVRADNVALYDPATGAWSALGTGTDGPVNAVAALPNGDLAIGGYFATAGSVAADGIAYWSGGNWHAFGAAGGVGVANQGSVYHLEVDGNGDLVAGGTFAAIGGVAVANIARWNGASWVALGTTFGGANGQVIDLASHPAHGLVAIGVGSGLSLVAAWNGASWTVLRSVSGSGALMYALAVAPNGDVYVGGAPFPNNLQRWDGTVWSAVSGATWTTTTALAVFPNGDLVAGAGPAGLTRFDGTSWTSFGSLNVFGGIDAIEPMPQLGADAFVAGGVFHRLGAASAQSLALWDGATMYTAAAGFEGQVVATAAAPDGDVYLGGTFTAIDGTSFANVARFDGASWHPLAAGSGVPIKALTVLRNGDVVALTTTNVRRFNGATWSPIPGGVGSTGFSNAIIERPNGNLVVAGGAVREWDGQSWSPLGLGSVRALVNLPGGDLVACGKRSAFPSASTVARWNGSLWTPLDPNSSAVESVQVVVRPNGDIATVSDDGVVSIYDGSSWQAISAPLGAPVNDIAVLPSGDLIAVGEFASVGASASGYAARWDGNAWHPVGNGLQEPGDRLVLRANGELLVVHSGRWSGNAGNISTLAAPCAPTAAAVGGGCPGSGGANRLDALAWPEVGSHYLARGSGLPSSGFTVGMLGWQSASVPLPSLLPEGQVGCELRLVVVGSRLLPIQNGDAFHGFDVPNVPGLVGLTFLHQMLPVETDPQGTILAVTATDALQLVIGSVL